MVFGRSNAGRLGRNTSMTDPCPDVVPSMRPPTSDARSCILISPRLAPSVACAARGGIEAAPVVAQAQMQLLAVAPDIDPYIARLGVPQHVSHRFLRNAKTRGLDVGMQAVGQHA